MFFSFIKSLCLLLIVPTICVATPPALTPDTTYTILEAMLKEHVTYHTLTPLIIKRSFQNYLEEIDPSKTYFLQKEVEPWLHPSETLLEQTVKECREKNYTAFAKIHDLLPQAIQRRNILEKELDTLPLPPTQTGDWKKLAQSSSWPEDEKALLERLLCIKSLQLAATQKTSLETKEQFLHRLRKRRLCNEEKLLSAPEKKPLILSYTLKALASALDSQTAYFTPNEAAQFMMQVEQKLFGIGAELRDDLKGFTVTRLLEGGPAALSHKLKLGDLIIAVDHRPIIGMDITEAITYIRGAAGTKVVLTIIRENQADSLQFDLELTRSEVILKESRLEKKEEPYADGIIGILRLFSFYQDKNSSSSKELKAILKDWQKGQRLKGVILDLRNNPGGILTQAVEVTSLFIQKGVVVSIKNNKGALQHLRSVEEEPVWKGPLIILTNRASASASEIVAQSLQDYRRALVVGDPETFGKGTFQTFTLESSHHGKVSPQGEYKVTRGKYYTVSGKSPQLLGVTPDIPVPSLLSHLEIGERFSKFPLENDKIPPHYKDDFSDIPSSCRKICAAFYTHKQQPLCEEYIPYIENLRQNSQKRIAQNPLYQNLQAQEPTSEDLELFVHQDLPLQETLEIMKDLLFLQEEASKEIVNR